MSRQNNAKSAATTLAGLEGRSRSRLQGQLEALEPRTMLSGGGTTNTFGDVGGFGSTGPVGGVVTQRWDDFDFEVRGGSWMVSFNDYLGNDKATELASQVATALGVKAEKITPLGRGHWAQIVTIHPVNESKAKSIVGTIPGLTSINPDRVYRIQRTPNDPDFTQYQWGLSNTGQNIGQAGVAGADIDALKAWDTTVGDPNVVVAIIDTGVQLDHPDLAPNIWTNPGEIAGNGIDDDGNGFVDDVHGWDFGNADNYPYDIVGHGTHCAGIVAARGNNGVGVTGVAWNIGIMALRVFDDNEIATDSTIVPAQDYATMMRQRGVNLVASNNSYGGFAPATYSTLPDGYSAEKDAISAFIASGGTFVAAAGNESLDNDNPVVRSYPASYKIPGMLTIAATDNKDNIASFSNYGAQYVTLGAPGVNILSTYIGSTYAFLSGTSMASPMVAGAVAILKSFKPNASAVELRSALVDSCDQLPALQGKTVSGGRLNLARALEVIGIAGPSVRAVTPGPVTGQLDPTTNTPIKTITITFNKPIDQTKLNVAAVELRRNGADNSFDTGDDVLIGITSVTRSASDSRVVTIGLNTVGLPQQRLPIDSYRLTLRANFNANAQFKDTDGNFLNGNVASGVDEVYNFEVVATSGAYEPNDTTAQATVTVFDANSKARFSGVTLGDGIAGSKDVDLYRIDMPRGGEIIAEIIAQRLPGGSNLDSVLRLFNSRLEPIALNDQYFGQDSYLDYFVSTGGTYYIGVSGFGNSNYNPAIANSGSTGSTGVYDVAFNINLASDDRLSVDASLPTPLAVPPTGTTGVTTSSIVITDSRQILDLNVRLSITHQYDSDLKVSLTSPKGTVVNLVNRRGGAGQNMKPTVFDDEALVPITSGVAPFAGTFSPETALTFFDGQSALGTWTLTIEDLAAVHTGQLEAWGLDFQFENDVFGPFEANDTLTTAKDLSEISASGFGSAQRDAFIGDGGFGLFDRDLWKVTVAAGATLSASVDSTVTDAFGNVLPGKEGSLNTVIRLFDSAGNQVLLSGPEGSKNARIENFVFSDAGTYYLGVSDGSNTNYSVFNVGTGTPSVTTGTYRLNVSVANGVSDASTVLEGNHLRVGMSSGGIFQGIDSNGQRVGIQYNGLEFLFRSSQTNSSLRQFYGAVAGGYNFTNQIAPTASYQLPVSLTNESDAYNRRVSLNGLMVNGMRVERDVTFGVDDSFLVVDVTLTNTTGKQLKNVGWMEAFNPEQGNNLYPVSGTTINDVDAAAHMATASYITNEYEQGITVGLAAVPGDARAKASVLNTISQIRDPSQLIAAPVNDPNGLSADASLSLVYNLGDVSAGQAVKVRYFVFFGDTPADVAALNAAVANGTGAGHLAAESPFPATETLADTNGTSVPQLPYRLYYPEGYATPNTSTFVPILNVNNTPARVIVIAHYETGVRDQLLSDFTVAANSRGGLTITNPALFALGTQLVRPYEGYAIEIRSDLPVAATFSHYDTNLTGRPASLGESFTTRISDTWTFGRVQKGATTSDFVLYYNTSDVNMKVTTTFYPLNGGPSVVIVQTVDGRRRLGLNINDIGDQVLPDGDYGVKITAQQPIVAVLSHYNTQKGTADGTVGLPAVGATSGATPEGQLGLDATSEQLTILNAGTGASTVTLTFLFSDGNSYRWVETVQGGSMEVVDVGSLLNFPIGQAYAVQYSATSPVAISTYADAYGDALITTTTDRAYSLWAFGEGYRPQDSYANTVKESLRLYNPSAADVLAEITIRYDGGLGTETFRQLVSSRKAVTFDIHNFITGPRRLQNAWYGISVKTATPIVASMDHYDAYFPGAFATLGTPLGYSTAII